MLLILALLPSVIILLWLRRSSMGKREPIQLLRKLFLFGALTVISAYIFEELFDTIFKSLDNKSMLFLIIDNFIAAGLVEELGKYIVLKKFTWNNPEYISTFGAVFYAVTVSLGFATVENITYVDEISTGISRAILSVPGHASNAVFMGVFYAKAKAAEANGNKKQSKSYLRKALIVPVLLHGFYDFCIESSGVYDNDFLEFSILLVFLVYAFGEMVVAMKIIMLLLYREDMVLKRNISYPWFLNKREIAYYSSIR